MLKNLVAERENSPSFTVSLPCEDNSSELSSWYMHIQKTGHGNEPMLSIHLCQLESDNWTEDSRVLDSVCREDI